MKREGRTYVTTTKKGDDVSTKLLQELIAYERLTGKERKIGLLKGSEKMGLFS